MKNYTDNINETREWGERVQIRHQGRLLYFKTLAEAIDFLEEVNRIEQLR